MTEHQENPPNPPSMEAAVVGSPRHIAEAVSSLTPVESPSKQSAASSSGDTNSNIKTKVL